MSTQDAPSNWEQAAERVMKELTELLIAKHHDYGPQNILKFGELGVLVRISDKLERLLNLHKKGFDPLNESALDNFFDIAGYAVIGVMLRKGWFEIPLSEKRGTRDPSQ